MLSILYGCDNNYAPYTGVSMTSLFENNQDVDNITVYLAAMDFSEENREFFSKTAARYGRKLVFLDTASALTAMHEYNCGSWNGSVATWLRFFVLDQIPADVDRLIWVDSDTIVENGIDRLAHIDLGDSEVAAVCDCISYRQRFRLGFSLQEPYYNAGVIVFHLQKWREDKTLPSLMSHLKKNISRYTINDQDLLNDYFRDRICKLPPQYNVQCFLHAFPIDRYYAAYPWTSEAYYTPQQIQQSLNEPVITHFFRFLGDYPWTQGKNYHPAKKLYEEWKKASLWRDHSGAAPRREFLFRAEKLLYRVLPRALFLRVFAWFTNRNLPKKPLKESLNETTFS